LFTPEGLQNAQQQMTQKPKKPPNRYEALKQKLMEHPEMRGQFKKEYGFDPLAEQPQTPAQKQQDALDLHRQKQIINSESKSSDIPTTAVLTQNQQALQGIDTVMPMLNKLIDSKDIPGIFGFSPGKKAAYNAKTSSMIDTLIAAQTLPKVQASIDLVEEQIRRKRGETVFDYKERLKDLVEDLKQRRSRAANMIKTRKINTSESDDFSNKSDEELKKIAGGG
jgi:hypothetical protein